MDKIELEGVDSLRHRKNLLAFSGGTDSSALFFLLIRHEIEFDIAIVDYQKRPNSRLETEYAKKLAIKFGKRLFLKECPIKGGNFEKRARECRYSFFEKIIAEHGYDNLITAHQLEDMLEWSLMQLCKGAGLVEMVGMKPIEKREGFYLVRPLLYTPKSAIMDYLKTNEIRYFIDKTNEDISYKRNYFRHKYAKELVNECAAGLSRSFRYLNLDKETLLSKMEPKIFKDLYIFKNTGEDTLNLRYIDYALKRLGYLASSAQKREILRTRKGVLGSKFAVSITKNRIFVSPYVKGKMPKKFKEACRVSRIPPLHRCYIFEKGIDPLEIKKSIASF